MKLVLLSLSLLAATPVAAAEPELFAPAPFRLEAPRPVQPSANTTGVRVEFPLGEITFDYSWMNPTEEEGYIRRLDAPGPGYRAQRACELHS